MSQDRELEPSEGEIIVASERLRTALDLIPTAVLVTLVNATLMAVLLEVVEPKQGVFEWLGSAIIIAVARLCLWWWYRHNGQPLNHYRIWSKANVCSAFAAGLVWGVGSVLLLPASEQYQLFWVFLIAGMSAGAASLHYPHWPTAACFIVPACVPLAIRFGLDGSEPHVIGAAMIVIFVVALGVTSRRASRIFGEKLQLQHALAQRTRELDALNEKLRNEIAEHKTTYRLAHHDTLTGLPNRVLLRDRLEQALTAARQTGRRVAVMVLDLDRFKDVNDTLGHAIGDELLCKVASRLRATQRTTDTIARFGGDEFVLIQPDTLDRASAGLVAQRLLASLTRAFLIQDNRLHIGASLGLTLFPDDSADPDRLFRNADIALYRAKREGRGHYHFYSPELDAELRANHSLEVGLRQAIECGALELFYQPTFSLESGRFQGVEALARWPRYRGGFVPPASFIPFAEASGLIVPLGAWALRQACHQARLWNDAGLDLRMSVNVSVAQLYRPDFAELIEQVLATTGLVSSALELEITEGVFLDASKAAIAHTLDRIAGMGVHLAIDDFGTGFSSLGYLNRFRFDRIKIDKSFVRDIGAGTNSDAIVKTIITLSRGLGKAVTAEGVETEEQLLFLRQHGCNEVQGFLLAQPVPASEIECLVSGRNSPSVGLGTAVVPLQPTDRSCAA